MRMLARKINVAEVLPVLLALLLSALGARLFYLA
jgi:hypothetical protein